MEDGDNKPTNGKTYGGTATLVDINTLELEGYLISLPFIEKIYLEEKAVIIKSRLSKSAFFKRISLLINAN